MSRCCELPQGLSLILVSALRCSFTLYVHWLIFIHAVISICVHFFAHIVAHGAGELELCLLVAFQVWTVFCWRNSFPVNAISGVLDDPYNASRTASLCVGHSPMSLLLIHSVMTHHCLFLSTCDLLISV
ncbi:hypothetical protein BDR03DRAFT_941785 [Suillus americanus]|nr:hypothetical protein BDR03DRAFT_941785 [Suillus americanus]